MERSIASLEHRQQNDTNHRSDEGANHQQISDSHHQHQQQQQDMVVSDHQQSNEHNNNGQQQLKSSPNRLHESATGTQHMSGHHRDDTDGRHGVARHSIIDAHTHVITETPHNSAHNEIHLKKEGQHSPSNIADHSAHGSPVHELTQASVGHSLDEKGVNHGSGGNGGNDSESLHSHLYSYHTGHQQHHQSR